MEMTEALFASLSTLWTSNTASGGLNDPTSNAFVHLMVQSVDPNYDSDRAIYPTTVVWDIVPRSDTTWGLSNARDTQAFMARATVRTWRDPGRTKQNAVSMQMQNRYDGATPQSQAGWVFSPLSTEGYPQSQGSGAQYSIVINFSGRAAAA